MVLDNFHRRAQSMGLLRLSSIPETQGNMSWVGTTNLDRSPSSLTQSSEAPFITPDVMNFNSLFCDSLKSTSSATTCKGTVYFQLCLWSYGSHQCCPSNLHFPLSKSRILCSDPFDVGWDHVAGQQIVNGRDRYATSKPDHSLADWRFSLFHDNLAVCEMVTVPPAWGPLNPWWTCSVSM